MTTRPSWVGGAPLDVADLVGETEALAIDPALAGSLGARSAAGPRPPPEAAGVEFIDENGGGPGVRVRPPKRRSS